MLFTAVMFSAGMPLLVPLAACFCLIVYNEGKLTLIRHSKKPPEYDEAMAEIFVRIAPWASVVKIPIAGWMLSYASVPTYKYTVAILDDALEPTEVSSQFNLNDRLDRSNAAVSVITLALLLLAYVIRTNQLAIKVGRRPRPPFTSPPLTHAYVHHRSRVCPFHLSPTDNF